MEESDSVEFSYIASKIIKKGINNVNFSMLPEDRKNSILSKVALLLYKENYYEEAIKIIDMSGNKYLIKSWMEEFISEKRSRYAVLCAIALKDSANIEKWAAICLEDGNYEIALQAYNTLEKKDMVDFIKANFL